MADVLNSPWRVGEKYGIHVYAGDVPVATFLRPEWAAQAVRDHNAALSARSARAEPRGHVPEAIKDLFSQRPRWEADAIVQTLADRASAKKVYNALNYLKRRGEIVSTGYGGYALPEDQEAASTPAQQNDGSR